MAGTTASNSWDEIWAEFDARQPARPAAPKRATHPRAPAAPRPAAGLRRLVALICLALGGLYLLSPLASALEVGAAIQRGDAERLARHLDRESLRRAVAATLAGRAREGDPRPMPGFITGMAQDMATRLAHPETLAGLLNARLAHPGPARELLGRVRILEKNLWQVALAPPQAPERAIWLTLALADPLRLRWEVRSLELPSNPGRW